MSRITLIATNGATGSVGQSLGEVPKAVVQLMLPTCLPWG
jgi:hypothetical protein